MKEIMRDGELSKSSETTAVPRQRPNSQSELTALRLNLRSVMAHGLLLKQRLDTASTRADALDGIVRSVDADVQRGEPCPICAFAPHREDCALVVALAPASAVAVPSTGEAVAEVAREFIAYYKRGGGCSNCGGLPHTTSCFVGQFEVALAAPAPSALRAILDEIRELFIQEGLSREFYYNDEDAVPTRRLCAECDKAPGNHEPRCKVGRFEAALDRGDTP